MKEAIIVKSMESINPSLPDRLVCKSVIQTILSYDIVKANGEEIKLKSTEEEGSNFIITLAIK